MKFVCISCDNVSANTRFSKFLLKCIRFKRSKGTDFIQLNV